MTLTAAATFGSLPEAQVAFSRLGSAGFHPVAGFNMNTPGSADGMAPSGYRVLVPEDEVAGARALLAELRAAMAADVADEGEDDGGPASTTLGRMRGVVRWPVAGVFVADRAERGVVVEGVRLAVACVAPAARPLRRFATPPPFAAAHRGGRRWGAFEGSP
jgi:hypothetical protein